MSISNQNAVQHLFASVGFEDWLCLAAKIISLCMHIWQQHVVASDCSNDTNDDAVNFYWGLREEGLRPPSAIWNIDKDSTDWGSGKVGAFVGRGEEDEDVKRLRQRAQDNIEFRSVTISAPLNVSGRRRTTDENGGAEGSLEMSISYRGRKGFMPDIESLVVGLVELIFFINVCNLWSQSNSKFWGV